MNDMTPKQMFCELTPDWHTGDEGQTLKQCRYIFALLHDLKKQLPEDKQQVSRAWRLVKRQLELPKKLPLRDLSKAEACAMIRILQIHLKKATFEEFYGDRERDTYDDIYGEDDWWDAPAWVNMV